VVSLAACVRSDQPRQILEPALSPVTVDWDLDFAREPLRKALGYWVSLCKDRTMPRRQELNPYRMRAFLPHVNLVQVVRESPGKPVDYIMTLEGQHTHEVYGAVGRRRLHEVLPPAIEERWRRGFGLVLEAARPARFSSSMHVGGKPWLQGEALVAPLGDEINGIEAFFAVFASWPAPGIAGHKQNAGG
jgi:hypothetical protein